MSHTPSKSFSDGKLRDSLVDADYEEELIRALEHGAEKYGDRNWEQTALYGTEEEMWAYVRKRYDSAARHLRKLKRAIIKRDLTLVVDDESAVGHTGCISANTMIMDKYLRCLVAIHNARFDAEEENEEK